ncbi:MAG: hypothetical protein Q8Q14_03870 [Gemmatimonadales bacterium]|nr:hypothetical protein [Gemmatimonadales bacterium]
MSLSKRFAARLGAVRVTAREVARDAGREAARQESPPDLASGLADLSGWWDGEVAGGDWTDVFSVLGEEEAEDAWIEGVQEVAAGCNTARVEREEAYLMWCIACDEFHDAQRAERNAWEAYTRAIAAANAAEAVSSGNPTSGQEARP